MVRDLSKGQVIVYRNKVEVRLEKETVWLNLNQMTDLFGRDKSVISRHLRNVFKEKELNKRRERKQNLIILREKLNNRLKQKEYVYTTKDAILIKEAINYLDNFISFYMKEWLKHIEPIINSIITNIGFTISFIINDKKEFEFILTREDKQYKYKDLSNGEKLILSIAFQLSLLLEKNETGLIIADEGFSSLDEDNLNLVFDLFKNLPFQLLCIIHRIDDISINVNVINLNKGV